jgi:hypothetical protein
LAAGAGIAPAFAPSKGAVLRLDDPAFLKAKIEDGEWKIAKMSFPSSIFNPPSSLETTGGAGGSCNLTKPD